VWGIHASCHQSSSCHNSGCSGDKKVITDGMTAAAYERKLRSTVIFRNLSRFVGYVQKLYNSVIAYS